MTINIFLRKAKNAPLKLRNIWRWYLQKIARFSVFIIFFGNYSRSVIWRMAGCNVGKGAGSIVTKSFLDSGIIIAGVPAKKIGNTEDLKTELIPFNLKTKGLNYTSKKKFLLSQPDSSFIKR